MTSITTPTKSLQVGVMLEAVQYSDVVGMDILGSISKEYVEAAAKASFPVSPIAIEQAREITFHYIASSLTEPAFMTPSLRFLPTVTYDTCPRELDILLVGGPLPTHRPAAADKFLKEVVETAGVIMSVCTGGWWLADAGVLKGKKATTNREALDLVRKSHPEVEWKDERWVVDGKFWTAGAAGCGIDMMVDYMKGKFGREVVEFALEAVQLGVAHGSGKFYED